MPEGDAVGKPEDPPGGPAGDGGKPPQSRGYFARQIKTLAIMLPVLAVIGAGTFWFYYRQPYRAAKRHIAGSIGTDRLQAWAVTVLDDPKRSSYFDKSGMMKPESIPAFVTPVKEPLTFEFAETGRTITVPMEIRLVEYSKDIDLEPYLLFPMGGGFYHHGFQVGRKRFVPRQDSQYIFEKLADGVWGFHEK